MAKILIAEDDKSARELFSAAVQSLGHCAIAAENGKVAWEILKTNEDISFVLCDLAMPVMDGHALIGLIRKDPRFLKTPILVVSGAVRAREISSLLESGATWFMAKPVNMTELMDHIKKQCR